MSQFRYEASNEEGRVVHGLHSADSHRRARDELRSRGLQVRSIREAPANSSLWQGSVRLRGGTSAFISDLATLLAVDVPLASALETLSKQFHGAARRAVAQIHDDVASGQSFATAMRSSSIRFDVVVIAMVEVGEATGQLDTVLARAAEYLERTSRFRDRVGTSLVYPAIVAVACIVVCTFLLTFVLPMLVDNLVELGRSIPWPTRVLRSIGRFLTDYWIGILLVLVCAGAGVWMGARTGAGARRLQKLLLRIPLIGEMWRKQEISRTALVLSTLLESGVVLASALELVERSGRNLLLRDALASIRRRIVEGTDLGRAVGAEKFFPPVVAHVFSIGQESGQLETLLKRIAADYDRQVDTMATRLSATIEPVMIVILTLVVGFIMFATLLPILEAGNVL